MSVDDVLHISPSDDENAVCEVHDWPVEGMARRLLDAMRARHGKGGLNVCVDCVRRARERLREFRVEHLVVPGAK